MEQKITLYQAIKNVLNKTFNETDNDDICIISRQEIIIKLYQDYNYYDEISSDKEGYPEGCYFYAVSSLDTIRNLLEKVGFLDKIYYQDKTTNKRKIKLGYYRIGKEIPKDLSQSNLRKIYTSFQNKLREFFEKHNRQPNDIDYMKLQKENYREFYG